MRLLHLVLDGLKGRKRDSAVLGGILLLAFLFLTLSSILLSSFAVTAQLQRQALHGNWQVMYYGAQDDTADRCAALTDCAEIGLVGSTKDGRLIGTIDDAVQALGSLEVTEGRLPQGEDEILLVRGRMSDEPALGETVDLAYTYDYMQGGTPERRGLREQAIIASARQTMTEDDWTAFYDYLREHYDPQENIVTFTDVRYFRWDDPYDFPYYLPMGYDLDRVLGEAEDDLLYYWVIYIYGPETFGDGAYETSNIMTSPGGLKGFEGFLVNVKSQGFRTNYNGAGFTDEVRESFKETGVRTSETLIYKTYTVVGYAAPYADHWDVRGCAMPDAFVSPEAGAAQLRALRYAEEFYYEGAPTYTPCSILLLSDPEGTTRQTVEEILPVYQEAQQPYFRMEAFVDDMMGQSKGFITGLDPVTGEEKSCQVMIYQNAESSNYVLQDNDGTWWWISGDPSAPERWEEFDDILLPLQPTELTVGELEQNNIYPLRLNNYSYPPSGNAEESLQLLCSGVLVGVAACSVFQVFWVQLRRRKMRLATMMSIGATDGQVLGMLLLEVLLLLAVSLVLGTALGFGLARLVTALTGARFTVEGKYLLGGMACCVAAVLIGALIPMLLVLHTPLTGREQVSRHTLHLRSPRRASRQSYNRILLRQMTVNRGRTALQFLLAWLLAVIALLTVFLCHGAYGGYRRSVTDTAMPDYEITAPYGMSQRFAEDSLEQAEQLRQGSHISMTTEAPNVWLHCDDLLEKSPILHTLQNMPQAQSMFRQVENDQTGFAVRVVGVQQDSDVLDRLLAMLPQGTVDREELEQGKACILLVPQYMPEGADVRQKTPDRSVLDGLRADEQAGYLLELHYNGRYRSVCREDTAIRPGDRISLTAYTQLVSEIGTTEVSTTLQPRVAAVISVLDEGIWPMSNTNSTHVVVSGVSLVSQLYSMANTRMTADQADYHRIMAQIFYPDCYGMTRFAVSNLPGSDPITQDTAAADFAEGLGLDFTNQRLQIEREASAAQRKMMLFLLLGVEMSLVVLTLLYSAAGVAVEQDRYRLGALQALGVTDRQMNRGQAMQALGIAAVACVAANLTLALVQLLTALMSGHPWVTLLENLNGYPWGIHALVCLAFLVSYTVLQSLPIRRVSRLDPIENIRS